MFGFSTLADDSEEEASVAALASEGRSTNGSGDGEDDGGEEGAGQDVDDGDHSSSDDDMLAPVSKSARCPRYLCEQRLHNQRCPSLGFLARGRLVVLLRRREAFRAFDPTTGSEQITDALARVRAPREDWDCSRQHQIVVVSFAVHLAVLKENQEVADGTSPH